MFWFNFKCVSKSEEGRWSFSHFTQNDFSFLFPICPQHFIMQPLGNVDNDNVHIDSETLITPSSRIYWHWKWSCFVTLVNHSAVDLRCCNAIIYLFVYFITTEKQKHSPSPHLPWETSGGTISVIRCINCCHVYFTLRGIYLGPC